MERAAKGSPAMVGETRQERALEGRTTIASFSAAPGNPYLRLLYGHLAAEGFALGERARLRPSWLWRNRRSIGYLHVHWPEGLYRARLGPPPLRAALSWLKLLFLGYRLGVARLLGYRLVWTVHQLYPHERDGHLRDRLAARILTRSASLLIAHDRPTADHIRAEIPSAAEKLSVVPHGSYIGVYPPGRDRESVRAELGIPPDAFVFLCFGQLRGYKDVDAIIEALTAAALPASRLVVAGHPWDRRVAEMVERAAADDSRIVPLLGFVPEERVAELFAACDAFVVSRADGGTSGSLLLAASLALPAVAADVPAYRDAVGDTAWYFTPGSTASLAAALAEAARDRRAALERGRLAHDAASRLSWPSIASETAALLRNVRPARR